LVISQRVKEGFHRDARRKKKGRGFNHEGHGGGTKVAEKRKKTSAVQLQRSKFRERVEMLIDFASILIT
jgi:hypothetical protein